MRISNNMMVYNFLTSLNKSQNLMNRVQEQLSDGKIVHRPSDDPIRAFRGLRFNIDLTMNEQYTQNAKDAVQWMNQTDTGLAGLSEIMQTAKENTIKAVSANTSDAQKAIGQTIDGLISQAVTIANSQIGERYIFAGQQDKIVGGPFERRTITVGGVAMECVIYKGDLNKISMPIQAGPSDPNKDSVNVTGEEAFGPLTTVVEDGVDGKTYQVAGIFTDLIAIKNQLATGKPDLDYLSKTGLANIDRDHDRIIAAQTQIGTRMASYEMAQNMMLRDNSTIQENQSANDDLDIARATIDFKNYQNIYNAALAVGAKIMPPSLADYLS